MKLSKGLLSAGALMLASMPGAALAQKVQSGTSSNGLNWKAASKIVGVRSTATVVGGGSPIYLAQADRYRGVVGLVMEYSDGSAFVCSGSLMSDRMSVLTAGHCVSGGAGTAGPSKVTAFFYDGNAADPLYYSDYLLGVPAPGVSQVDVSRVIVNGGYTGEVIDQNDIAVLRLANAAPTFANSYGLYTGDLSGTGYNIAGYGGRSDGGGNVGDNLGTGRLRQGDNRYDYRLGDAAFGGLFTDTDPNDPNCQPGDNFFCGSANIANSWVSDFDNGFVRNDTACLLAVFGVGTPVSGKFCNTGVGVREVSSAGGDSGGPQFVNGQVASVTSYGLSFGENFGDVDGELNSSFGEFNGFVPVAIHQDFIAGAMGVPEPATWALMIVGFGAVGGSMRRRTRVNARVAIV